MSRPGQLHDRYKRPLSKHAYSPSGPADHNGDPWCICGLPKKHTRHAPPTPIPEAAELDRRLLGEKPETL